MDKDYKQRGYVPNIQMEKTLRLKIFLIKGWIGMCEILERLTNGVQVNICGEDGRWV